MKFNIGDKVKSKINGKSYVILDIENNWFRKNILNLFTDKEPDLLLKREDGEIGYLYSGEVEKI